MNKFLIQKIKWDKSSIKEVCLINPSKRELCELDYSLKVSFGMMDELPEHKPFFTPFNTRTYKDVQKGGYTYFIEGDVLLAKMTPCFENGKSGIATNLKNGIGFGSTEFFVLRPFQKVIPYWIYSIISSDVFINKGKYSLVGTTGRRRLMKQFVENFEIPLPPLQEQKQLAELFQSLDETIDQTETQQGNFRKLRTHLASELVSINPKFGNLLNGNCKKILLSDIAIESRSTAQSPTNEGIEKFVGLEHIESANLKIQGGGNVADGTTFTKVFEIGDVLFGRRRAYLKKAAKADFKGLCSGDITVLKANTKKILPELLPYYMSSDPVFEFAVRISAGSLSPRAKWKDLSKMELAIPDLKTQKEILKVFHLLDKNIDGLTIQKETLKKLKHKLLDEILG